MKIEVLKIKKNRINLEKPKVYKNQIIVSIFLTIISIFFIINSGKYINIVLDGILLYGTKILPTLLPFFFITNILSNFDLIYLICNQFSSLTKFLFNTKSISAYIFFMSIISGYPMGAKLTAQFYENKLIDEIDAQKILSFCSTSGPLFIIGTVGIGFFHNQFIGIMLLLVHIISSIINGIIYRNFKGKNNSLNLQKNEIKYSNNIAQNLQNFSLQNCMFNAINSVLIVGGYIIIFYVLIEIMLDYNLLFPLTKLLELLGLPMVQAKGLTSGLIEITKGISILSLSPNLRLNFIISSFLISFSGISILMQATTFLDKSGVNKKLYVLQKITHGFIALILSIIVCLLIF